MGIVRGIQPWRLGKERLRPPRTGVGLTNRIALKSIGLEIRHHG